MTTNILIIDDSEDDQRLYQHALKAFDHSYSLVMESSAEAGLAHIADASPDSKRPDLILLDYNLPDLDGLGFMKRLAEYSDTPIPIVMLTGEDNTAVAVEVMKHGADDYLVKDTEGRYLRLLPGVIGRVMTTYAQREQTRRLQQETEALLLRYKQVIETAMDGFWLVDIQGNLLDANLAYAEMSGYSIDELKKMHVSQLEAKEQPKDVAAHIEKVIAQGCDCFETRHRRKDGQEIDMEVSVTVMPETQQFFVFCRDITERKKAGDALRVAAVAFETHDAILITDRQANIIRVNQAFTDITGYSPEDVLGQNPRIMSSGRQDKTFFTEMWQQLLHTGSWAGEILDKRKNGQIYPKWLTITAVRNERQEITNYVAIFSDITARKQDEEEIRNLAFYDALTGLPNRRLFMDRFRAALTTSTRRNDYGAVLFIDMDRFKTLNDTLGHDYGDLLLIEVAARIKSCIREMDTVARLGGDEFVVLIEGVSEDQNEAARKVGLIAEKIRTALAHLYKLKSHGYHSSPSIGISLYRGNEKPVDELIQQADQAMYQAKGAGRNAVRFSDPVMQHNLASNIAR